MTRLVAASVGEAAHGELEVAAHIRPIVGLPASEAVRERVTLVAAPSLPAILVSALHGTVQSVSSSQKKRLSPSHSAALSISGLVQSTPSARADLRSSRSVASSDRCCDEALGRVSPEPPGTARPKIVRMNLPGRVPG